MKIADYLQALSDKLVCAKSCFFGHKWKKWEVKIFRIVPDYHEETKQERQCIRCGITQVKGLYWN